MTRLLVPALLGLALGGCASFWRGVVPGEPVTAERCRRLDLAAIGYKDGESGQRRGEKFEFWMKDCRGVGVRLDRATYDEGYDRGLEAYCGCEAGFKSGVRGEYLEMKGQYQLCTRARYGVFALGHAAGAKFAEDPSYVRKDGPYRKIFLDDAIQLKAKEECASPGGASPAAPTVPARPTDEATKPSTPASQPPGSP